MAYFLSKDMPYDPDRYEGFDLQQWIEGHENYRAYLKSLEGRMPASAYEFATAEWHYTVGEPLSPHDAGLMELLTREPGSHEWTGELWTRIQGLSAALMAEQPEADSGEEYEQWEAKERNARLEWQKPTVSAGSNDSLDMLLRFCTDEGALLQLLYQNVQRYALDVAWGAWRYDEVRLTENGYVVHELELISAGYWTIECEDIVVSYQLDAGCQS